MMNDSETDDYDEWQWNWRLWRMTVKLTTMTNDSDTATMMNDSETNDDDEWQWN